MLSFSKNLLKTNNILDQNHWKTSSKNVIKIIENLTPTSLLTIMYFPYVYIPILKE